MGNPSSTLQLTERNTIMFTPKQKVACINATLHPSLWQYVKPLVKDAIYTIRDVVPGIAPNGEKGNVTVYLEEIFNTVNDHGIERGYNAERFAPLQTDDVEESIWETAPQEELVPA